jgi:cobalamin biosynthesis Mg chelatase CobN
MPEAPKLAEHQPEELPKPAHAPQALAVHKAPADDDSEKSTESASEPAAQDDAAVAEEQAHQESTVSTGPHAPVGVIVVTVLAMILLCALATMIYFDTQK